MADMIDKLRQSWSAIALVLTLVGSGVGWTAYLQGEISDQIQSAQIRSDATYYARIKGELLEQRMQSSEADRIRIENDIRSINSNLVLILRTLEKLEERSNGPRR